MTKTALPEEVERILARTTFDGRYGDEAHIRAHLLSQQEEIDTQDRAMRKMANRIKCAECIWHGDCENPISCPISADDIYTHYAGGK